MGNLTKLGFALCLAIAAAAVNWIWLASQVQPPKFVAVSDDIRAGDLLREEDLVAVPVPGKLTKLKRVLIPYANRAVLFQSKATRDYAEGDVVFQRDIRAPQEPAEWDYIGPFRLESVGQRQAGDIDSRLLTTERDVVEIAVDADFDEKTSRLLEVLSVEQDKSRDDAMLKIVAVQIDTDSNTSKSMAREQTAKGKHEVIQAVSLRGITNIPTGLVKGDLIRFVIRAAPSF